MPAPISKSLDSPSDFTELTPASASFRRMTWLDWALVVALCLVLFAVSAYRSRTRLFWADELISRQMFSDPSFLHMLRAWYRGADSGGLTYYLLCPLWLHLFGLSELSLRLFSTAGMCVALALLWTALRRYVSTFVTAAALGVVFFTSPAMLWQEINGRFYGLYFAFAALAALVFLLVNERDRPGSRLLAALFLAHAGLVASHIFGIIFSASLIAGTWAADRFLHRTRWRVYLIPAAGWLAALLSLPSLRASASVVQTVFWTRKPAFADLLYVFAGYGRPAALLLGGVLGAAVLRLLWVRVSGSTATRGVAVPLAPAALVGSLVLAAVIFFVKSQTGISIFADRYLLPVMIASAVLIAGSLAVLFPMFPTMSATSRVPATLTWSLLVLVPCCLFGATRQYTADLYPARSYVPRVNRYLRPGVPAVTVLPEFPFLHAYDPQHRFLYMTNWPYDNDPRHLADYSGERLMENWKNAGYLANDILPCSEIFARSPRLDMLIGLHLLPWFQEKVLHDPHLRVTPVGMVHEWDWIDVWEVDRVSPGPPPC